MHVVATDREQDLVGVVQPLAEPIGREHPTFETLIEVFDSRNGNLLAEHRFPGMLGTFLEGLHVIEPDLDAQGEQLLRILRLRLEGAP